MLGVGNAAMCSDAYLKPARSIARRATKIIRKRGRKLRKLMRIVFAVGRNVAVQSLACDPRPPQDAADDVAGCSPSQ